MSTHVRNRQDGVHNGVQDGVHDGVQDGGDNNNQTLAAACRRMRAVDKMAPMMAAVMAAAVPNDNPMVAAARRRMRAVARWRP